MRKEVIWTGIFIILYILLGHARSIQPNPFIPGAIIQVNIIIPVIAGILFGARSGLLTGFLGTSINAIIGLYLGGAYFEALSILPHTIMGWVAGKLRRKTTTVLLALIVGIGQLLNLLAYTLVGAVPWQSALTPLFWYGLLYELFVSVIAVVVIVGIYRLGFEHGTNN